MAKREKSELEIALKEARLASYARVRGGYSVPLAGALYWLGLGILGYFTDLVGWTKIAFPASGLIFPVAVLFGAALKNPWLKDQNPTSSLLPPALISMLLFWAFIVAAAKEAPTMLPLLLAIGMSFHWPAIGRIHLGTGGRVVRLLGQARRAPGWHHVDPRRRQLPRQLVAQPRLRCVRRQSVRPRGNETGRQEHRHHPTRPAIPHPLHRSHP